MKNYNIIAFQQNLNAIDWESLVGSFSLGPSKMASVFQELFDAVLSLHPLIRKQKAKVNMLHGSTQV